jgi:hypothetical protein
MRVAIYDVDSAIPNLALMKLSRFHKESGDNVVRYDPLFAATYDKVYASKIFLDSDGSLLNPEQMEIGGSGWNLKTTLPPEIEALQPDYSFYNYSHNIGFAMRGCRFQCKFCIVPQKEGRPKSSWTIAEIWQQRHSDFIMLLDNDFFGNPDWRERIAEILRYDLRVNFNQGLNIRIITEEQCEALAGVRFSNIHGTKKQVHFAWDQMKDERLIRRGYDRVVAAGIKPYQMAFYVLIGFDTTPEQDFHRVSFLRDWGCDPYVMPYKKTDAYQRNFARWVNHKAIFKKIPWPDYKRGIKRGDSHEGQLNLGLGVE